jgi:hypothetical protein
LSFSLLQTKRLLAGWGVPGLSHKETGQDEVVAYLALAFGRAGDEFVGTGLVVGKDAAGRKGTAINGGIHVDAGLFDDALGCVVDSERDHQGKREEDHPVGGVFLEVEGCGSHDVSSHEGGAGAVAGGDIGGGCINNACKSAGDFDGSVLHAKELRVVVAMPKEKLMFEAGVRVHEGTVLWLEDGVDALLRGYDVETHKEVVVCQSNDMLRGGEGLSGS